MNEWENGSTNKQMSLYTNFCLFIKQFQIFGQRADRKDVPDVLLVFSDGQSHDHSKAVRETTQMKKEGVAVLCVAIGGGATNGRLIGQLQQLASKPEHVFKSAMDALDTIEDTLVKDMCDVVGKKFILHLKCEYDSRVRVVREYDLKFKLDGVVRSISREIVQRREETTGHSVIRQ